MIITDIHVLGSLSTYLNGRLEGSDRAYVEKHLLECESCRAHSESIQMLRGMANEGLTRYTFPKYVGLKRAAKVFAAVFLLFFGIRWIRHHRKPPETAPTLPFQKTKPLAAPAPIAAAPTPVPKPEPSVQALRELAANVQSAPAPATPKPTPAPQPPAISDWKGTVSSVSDFRPVIIQTKEAWEALWQEHHQGQPATPSPTIDFGRSMVVGIYTGTKPTAGYAIEITDIQTLPDQVIVSYKESAPLEGSVPAQVTSSPYHLRVISKTILPIRFVKQ